MKMQLSQTHEGVVITKKMLQFLGIKVNPTSVDEKITNHPSPHSLLSIANSLTDWNIDNLSLRLSPNEFERIHEFNAPFVGIVNENGEKQFLLVDKVEKNAIHYQDTEGGASEALDKFFQRWTGYALLAFPSEKAGEKDFITKKNQAIVQNSVLIILCLAILTGLVGLFTKVFQSDLGLQGIGLIVLKLMGLVISSLLIKHDFDAENSIVNRVCSANKSDCNKVLNSKDAKLFGLVSWSELGLIYFGGSLLFLLFSFSKVLDTIPILFYFNASCVLFSFYSLWYQAFKAKEWCYFCLAVLGIFALEFIVLLPFSAWTLPFDWQISPMILLSFGTMGAVGLFVKLFFEKEKQLKRVKNDLNFIKYDATVFNQMLQMERSLDIQNSGAISIFGDKNAANTLTIVTSPSCGPCFNTHNQLSDYLNGSYDNLKINIVFLIRHDSSQNTDEYKVVKRILALYRFKGQEAALKAMENWYDNDSLKTYETWDILHPVENEAVEDMLLLQKEWCKKNKISFTPTRILNQKQLPKYYQVSDLKYFID